MCDVEKMKVPIARILTGLLAHYTHVGNMLLLTLYKELCPGLWAAAAAAGEQRLEWWQCWDRD